MSCSPQTVIVGQEMQVRLMLTDAEGAPVAGATGVTVRAKPPTGAVRAYPASASDVPGEWRATILFDLPGKWWVAGECTAPSRAVDEVQVTVHPRNVP